MIEFFKEMHKSVSKELACHIRPYNFSGRFCVLDTSERSLKKFDKIDINRYPIKLLKQPAFLAYLF